MKSQPIIRRILFPMILLVIFDTIILTASIFGGGVLDKLRQNEKEILQERVSARKNYLQNEMNNSWSNISLTLEKINDTTQQLLNNGQIQLETLDNGSYESTPEIISVQEDLIAMMRSSHVTGAFLVLNTEDLSGDMKKKTYHNKPGIYLRDGDPLTGSSVENSDILIERAPIEVVNQLGITTDRLWKPQFAFAEENKAYYPFFYEPFQNAYEKAIKGEAANYGYWSEPYALSEDDTRAISYSVPLILEDGTVYGVLGVEISMEYLRKLLPYKELNIGGNGSYIIGIEKNKDEILDNVLINGPMYEKICGKAKITTLIKSGQEYAVLGKDKETVSYAALEPFVLYGSHTPFVTQKWYMVGVVEYKHLTETSFEIMEAFSIAVFITLFIGIIGSIIASNLVADPIAVISEEIMLKNADEKITLKRTKIKEINQMIDAIERLSSDAIESKTKLQIEKQSAEQERDSDFLTGLMSRGAFQKKLKSLFGEHKKDLKIAALVMMDLDNLKTMNDTYGHDWGDTYIQQAAKQFQSSVPSDTIVARMSGDEFYIFFYGYDTKKDIRDILANLKRNINESIIELPTNETINISVSIGIAWYPDDSESYETLLYYSDFAMYQVKHKVKGEMREFDKNGYNQERREI